MTGKETGGSATGLLLAAPAAIGRGEGDTLVIRWNDGGTSRLPARSLRLACPCAACVNEWTGEKILQADKVPENVVPIRLVSVGRYAMAIHFSDGHKTGIFSFDYLRRLRPVSP